MSRGTALSAAVLISVFAVGGAQTLAWVEVAAADSVILWNKLESPTSEVGATFGQHEPSDIHFDTPGVFGNSLRTTGGSTGQTGGYMTMSADDFFGADKSRGTVELWIQKGVERCIAYETGMPNVFGHVPFGGGYYAITAVWADDWTNYGHPDSPGGMRFDIHDGDEISHSIIDEAFQDISVGTWLHYGFVWDIAGIAGASDTMRLYRDGVMVASTDEAIPGIWAGSEEVRVYGHHQFGRLNQSMLYLDNLKVWDEPLTDFSHRFDEDWVPEPTSLSLLALGALVLAARRFA